MKQRANRKHSGAPTIADVAKKAGVSPMTVSRVINEEKNVRESTRKNVLAAIDALGYSPNQAARSLASAGQIQIGLLYDNPRTSYVSAFLIGGLQQTSKRNVRLIARQCETPEEAAEAINSFALHDVDGVILPPPQSDWPAVTEALARHDIPTVLVATGMPHTSFSAVGIDDYLAALSMTNHLISLGHERIGFITGDPKQEASVRRLDGYRSALKENNLPIDDELIVAGNFTFKSGLEAASTLLDLDPKPTAIFASNDDMAAAAIAVAHRRGLDIPRDLSVCGFDDTALAETLFPELTTIHQPIGQMSREAVDQLIDKIRGRREGARGKRRHIVLDFTLVRRQSDGPPPID